MQEVIINEEWRSISGYLNYQVSNIGRVRNTRGHIMTRSNNNIYMQVMLGLNGNYKTHSIHRLVAQEFIPNPMNKPTVDHIDNDAKHNNTIGNLRWATRKEQNANKSKQLNATSKYKGVSWNKRKSRWEAYIKVDGKQMHLGYFESEEEAALSYNKRASEHYGDFAKLNVIENNQD